MTGISFQKSISTPTLVDGPCNNSISSSSFSSGDDYSLITKLNKNDACDQEIKDAIKLFEENKIEEANKIIKKAAEQNAIAMFLYGISLRHGWVFITLYLGM